MFTNYQINLDELPQVETLEMHHLHPNLKKRAMINRVLFSLIFYVVIIALFLLIPLMPALIISSVIFLITSTIIIWPNFSVPKKKYALRDHDIVYQNGLLWKSFKALPFNRLQHIELTRSPIDRSFGLATLIFYTAGGSYGDLRIAGFEFDEATQIREHILSILNQETNEPA